MNINSNSRFSIYLANTFVGKRLINFKFNRFQYLSYNNLIIKKEKVKKESVVRKVKKSKVKICRQRYRIGVESGENLDFKNRAKSCNERLIMKESKERY